MKSKILQEHHGPIWKCWLPFH